MMISQLQWKGLVAAVTAALEEPLEFYTERDQSYIADRVRICIQKQVGKF